MSELIVQVASDDSDYEDEEAVPQASGKITIQMVNKWENDLNANKYVVNSSWMVLHFENVEYVLNCTVL